MEEQTNHAFVSTLETPIQRAMSGWLHHAFTGKNISSADFIEHFGIIEVIKKLSPKVRGKVLVTCNGGGDSERASKMNADIVASTVASMLEDKLVMPEDICKEISTDHMVEVLPSNGLYRLIFGKRERMTRQLMTHVHKILLGEHLLGDKTASSYMRTIGDDKIINEQTPPVLLALCQMAMLEKNRAGTVFTDDDVLGIYTPRSLVEYVDLADLFTAVEAVAKLNGWIEPKPGLPEGVVTPSDLPPPPAASAESTPPPLPGQKKKPKKRNSSNSDDEPEVTTTAVEGSGEELTLDIDEEEDGTPATT
ncbi:hypothetical protein IT407_01300 [Candidatus Uhrbacteria bacterium]|nr:hypothetical protein [Candidatus Uhrbacteria bacterium]